MKHQKIIFFFLLVTFIILTYFLALSINTKGSMLCSFSPSYTNASWGQKISEIINSSNFVLGFVAVVNFIILILIAKIGFANKGILKKGTCALLIIVILFAFQAISIPGISAGVAGRRANDAQRIANINRMQIELLFYMDENGKYPGVSGSNQWEVLEEIWASDNPLPSDPCSSKNPERVYEYRISPDGQKYVLKAYLQTYNHHALNNDLDGNILGVYCGENGAKEIEYCLSAPF